MGGARVGGGANVGGARPGGAAPAVRVQPGPQVRDNVGGAAPGAKAGPSVRERITTARPNIDVDSRPRIDPRAGGQRPGADVNVRNRVDANVADRAREALDARNRGNLDARVRAGAPDGPATARDRAGNRADRVGDFLDLDRRTPAEVRNRPGADLGDRARAAVDARNRAAADARANVRDNLRPSWANQVRVNENVSRNLANALQRAARAQAGVDARRGADHRHHWDRDGHYDHWTRNTRNYWSRHGSPYFGAGWWGHHHFHRPHTYFNYWYGRPYAYWWAAPSWTAFNGWFGWGGWNTPYYYSYGPSGYVVYRDDGVYIGDQYVGTPEVYAASAAQLAAIDPNQLPAAEEAKWMPLGTFAFITSEEEAEQPTRFLQLAVDPNGLISGTMFNANRDQAYSVEGRVDKDTQRVAFTISNNRDIVFETGIYNLTQDESQILAHFSPDDTRTFLLVRLQEPEQGAEELKAEATMTAPLDR